MKVNILMSTYNGEKYLEEQIQSIQAQTYKDWQLLIRDDASTDGTTDIIKKYAAEDLRIHWINEGEAVNLGVVESFYKLVYHELADLYFFSDQDDVWLEDKLETQITAFNHEPADQPTMVYMDLTVVDQDLNVINQSMVRTQSGHANTQLVQEMTENTVTGGVSGINHALAQLWTETDGIIMHDWYLALLATALGKLIYIDQAGELYRQHSNNVLGARTLSKRVKNWIRPQYLVAKYWWLIKSTQIQAALLKNKPINDHQKVLIDQFVTIMDQPFSKRLQLLRENGYAKNKLFHTIVFKTLILTKIGYRRFLKKGYQA